LHHTACCTTHSALSCMLQPTACCITQHVATESPSPVVYFCRSLW
jgi:hypothetical protein